MFKMNKSHLNKAVVKSVLNALRESLKTGLPVYIKNRKGAPYMRLKPVKVGGRTVYELTDKTGTHVKDLFMGECLKAKYSPVTFKIIQNNLV